MHLIPIQHVQALVAVFILHVALDREDGRNEDGCSHEDDRDLALQGNEGGEHDVGLKPQENSTKHDYRETSDIRAVTRM